MADAVDLVRRSLDPDTREQFDHRVDEQAGALIERIRDGDLDNADPAVGLEVECYLVDRDGRLAVLRKGTFEDAPVSRELGLHNIEINTPASIFTEVGWQAQVDALHKRFEAANRIAERNESRVVLDGMWTIPPAGGTHAYLGEAREENGVVFPEHMTASPRYHAIDNHVLEYAGGEIELTLPGATVTVPSILVESLTTSIQPHLQVPRVDDFVTYYNTAIRTLGPVLAISTNSPFLPADLYGDIDPERLLDETYHELRVPVFEQSVNAGQSPGKVRFPGDITSAEDVVTNLVGDRPIAPFLREWVDDDRLEEEFTDTFWELDHKHGTYWRWLRGVLGGDLIDEDNDERSLRIEYRPLPTQPSLDDILGVQCLVSGLIHGLVIEDHPLRELSWEAAKRSFYNAVSDGPDARLQWVTADGSQTAERDRIYEEIFSFSRRGLRDRGITDSTIERHIRPIEMRWRNGTAPSVWKLDRVRAGIRSGDDLVRAISDMQRTYIDQCGTPFSEWV